MSKKIDSIGHRPDKKQAKPVSEYKAGEVVRPKGSSALAGESVKPANYQAPKESKSTIGKPSRPKKPVNKKKRLAIVASVILLLVISLGAIWLVRGTSLLDSIGKPKPAKGNYAEVGDQSATLDEFEKMKSSYLGFNSKQSAPGSASQASVDASKDLLTFLALKAEAKKLGIECTQDLVDRRNAEEYASLGGKDAFYAHLRKEYNWDPSVTFVKTCIEYYKEVLSDRLISGTDVFGVYIRWGQIGDNLSTQERENYEKEAMARLERDFLPLFESGASKEEIYRSADISPYSSEAEFDKKMETPGSPWVRTVEYPRLNEASYSTFRQFSEGERDIDHISKLAVGENTKVFKSKTGYYAIFRATNRIEGSVESMDQLIEQYLQSAKYSNEYYALPKIDSTEEKFDINNPNATQGSTSGFMNSVRQALVPTAQAGTVQCWKDHQLIMHVAYRDYVTKALIPMPTNPRSTIQIQSTSEVRRQNNNTPSNACDSKDTPPAGNVPAWGLSISYSNGNYGRIMYNRYNFSSNPWWSIGLSCYTGWNFTFNEIPGYQPVNYGDASQFLVDYADSNGWKKEYTQSAISGSFRIPAKMYNSIANGALGYSITVYMKKDSPPPPPPPLMTVSGHKQDEFNDNTGSYKDNVVSMDNTLKSSAQPYSFTGILANQAHAFTVDPEPGYDLLGYRVNGQPLVKSNTYMYPKNAVGDGAKIDLDWIFRKRPTVNLNVTCSTISGSVIGGGNAKIEVYARVSGENLVNGSNQVIYQTTTLPGRNFSFAVPEMYKDGVSRGVQIRLRVDNVDIGTVTGGSGTLSCSRNATCVSNNLADVFPDGRATLNVGDGENNIKIGMKNVGEAIWDNYTRSDSGVYRLSLTDEAKAYWDISVTGVTSKIYPAPAPAGKVDSIEFSPVVTLRSPANQPSIPLGFRMEFVPNNGTASTAFGGTCGIGVRILSAYGPWLRTQNGNVSAMGIIQGQDPVTTSGGSLGGRRAIGSGSGVDKDELNYEATFSTMSQNRKAGDVIASAISSSSFCSTNHYLFGRDEDSGTSDVNSCNFDAYAFKLRNNLEEGLKKGSSAEVIYKEAKSAYNSASCDPGVGPTQSGSGRYAKGGAYNGNNSIPGLAGACPTITELTELRDGIRTLGANKNSAPPALQNLTVQSRSTIIVDGDLYLNANIRNAQAQSVSFNVDDLKGLNNLPNLGIIVRGNIIIDRDVTQIDAFLYAGGEIRTCDLYNPDDTTEDSSSTSTGFKSEISGGTVKNPTASQCSNRLIVHGLAAAKEGFKFGRNHLDFGSIAHRIGVPNQNHPNFDYGPDRSLYYSQSSAEDFIYNGIMLLVSPPGFEHISHPDFSTARYVSDDAQPRF